MGLGDRKLIGILICVITGSIILAASLLYSSVDQARVEGNALTDFGAGWEIQAGAQIHENVSVPTHLAGVKLGEAMVLRKQLPKQLDGQEYLFFRASHQNVRVFLGESQVYSFGWGEHRLFSKSPACTWVLVPLSEEQSGSEVRIELQGAYKRYANLVNEISIGDKSAIIHNIASERHGSVIICLILMIIGMSMILVSAALRSAKVTASLQRLGFLSVLIGIWSLCVTNTLQLLYGNVYVLLNLEFFTFNLLLPVFLWFLQSFLHYRDRKWLSAFFWCSVVLFLLIEALQLAGIADYMETITFTHILMAACMITIIGTGLRDLFYRNATREEKILVVSVVLMLIFAGIDMGRFYQADIADEGFYTRIGTMLFIAVWALEVMRNISRQFMYMAKTEALEVLAYEDLMTGLKNRTAFEEWLNTYESAADEEEAYIVAFDMNGLKDINDTYGHMKGDQAITSIARVIKEAFEPLGISYRTGGDEICAIVPVKALGDENRLIELLKKVDRQIEEECKALNMEFSVAAGYAKASANEKKDIYQAYREADRLMYVCKQKMKGEH